VLRTIPSGPGTPGRTEDFVRHATWARRLSHAQLGLVLDHLEERRFDTGACMLHAGEVVEHWTGIVDGFAKMSVTSAQGRVSTLTGVCAGVWFGEGSLMKHEARRYDVYALRPLRMALVPRRVFECLRETSIPFNHYLQDLLNARLSLFIGTLSDDRLLDTDARVAHSLASLFDEDLYPQAAAQVRIDQTEVGLLANVSRQRAHQALHRLEDLGLLRLERCGLTVLDVAGLRHVASGQAGLSPLPRPEPVR
jgi:CRP/FNR family cyclic AMP-dependent transcriptional regulator